MFNRVEELKIEEISELIEKLRKKKGERNEVHKYFVRYSSKNISPFCNRTDVSTELISPFFVKLGWRQVGDKGNSYTSYWVKDKELIYIDLGIMSEDVSLKTFNTKEDLNLFIMK